MKPVLEHLPLNDEESFFVQEFELPYFGTPWHYHPEFELVHILESEGKRFVGNSVADFKAGDLSFFGSHLPHLYRNPSSYYERNSALRARSIVVHFLEKSMGSGFLNLPQTRRMAQFLELSRQGVDIYGKTKRAVAGKMKILLQTAGLQRLMHLIEILDILADSAEYKLISEPGIVGHNAFDSERLDRVFQYILQNFHKEIRLEDVANLIYMTRTSFCRFFLERTKRTFSDYLSEVRLNHAAALLIEKNMNITKIAYDSGYNNLSNFNRQFKGKYQVCPNQYRHKYLKEKRDVLEEFQ